MSVSLLISNLVGINRERRPHDADGELPRKAQATRNDRERRPHDADGELPRKAQATRNGRNAGHTMPTGKLPREAQATRNDRERRPHDANREAAKGGTGHSRPQAETDVTAAGDSSEAELPPAVATAAKACGPRGPHRQAVGRKRDATEGDGHPAQAADTERLQTTKPKLIISYGKKTK